MVDDFADIKNICKTFLINTQSYDEENEYDLEKTIVQINKEKIKRFTSYNTNECIEMVNNLKFTDTIEQTESNYSKAFKDLEKDNSIITLAVIIKPSSQQLNPVRYNNVCIYSLFMMIQ